MQKRKRKTVSVGQPSSSISPPIFNLQHLFLALTVGIVVFVVLGQWTSSSLLGCLTGLFIVGMLLAILYAFMRNIASAISMFRNPSTAFFEMQGFVVSQGIHPEYGTPVTQVTLPENPSDDALRTQQMMELLYEYHQQAEKTKNERRAILGDDTSHLDEMLQAGWINQDEYDRIKRTMSSNTGGTAPKRKRSDARNQDAHNDLDGDGPDSTDHDRWSDAQGDAPADASF
jgi:hypothetical protein